MKTMLTVAREWLAAEQQRLAASGETVHTGHPAHIVEWLLEEVYIRTLTDAEREAIEWALEEGVWSYGDPEDWTKAERLRAFLRGLLDRSDRT